MKQQRHARILALDSTFRIWHRNSRNCQAGLNYLIGDEDLADGYMGLVELSTAESVESQLDLNTLASRIESECRVRLLLESRVNSLERQVSTLQKQLSNRK